jgi:hypothetical protein
VGAALPFSALPARSYLLAAPCLRSDLELNCALCCCTRMLCDHRCVIFTDYGRNWPTYSLADVVPLCLDHLTADYFWWIVQTKAVD